MNEGWRNIEMESATLRWKVKCNMEVGIQNMRKIFRRFSAITGFDGWMMGKLRFWHEQPDSEGGTAFTSDASQEPVCIRKKSKNFAILEGRWDGFGIQMYLLKPQKQLEAKHQENHALPNGSRQGQDFPVAENSIVAVSKIFSSEDITAFVKDVGDDNWIHQTDMPVVPGFLMMEWILACNLPWGYGAQKQMNRFANGTEAERCRNGKHGWKKKQTGNEQERTMVFHAPAYAGELVEVYQDSVHGELSAITKRDGKNVLLWRLC